MFLPDIPKENKDVLLDPSVQGHLPSHNIVGGCLEEAGFFCQMSSPSSSLSLFFTLYGNSTESLIVQNGVGNHL